MTSLCPSLLLLPALLLGNGVATASQPHVFDRNLPVSGPVVLEVSTGHGSINVTEGNDYSVRVHGIVRPLYGRLDLGLAQESIRAIQQNPPIEQTGSHIRIGFTQLEKLTNVSMTIELEMPKATRIHAQTSSGGIRINGPFGPVVAITASGQTEITDVTGRVSTDSRSGGVIIRGAGANAVVRTKSGGVQVASVRGGLDLRTESGRIEVSDVHGDLNAITRTGKISVDNATGSLMAKNTSGSIDAFQLAGAVHAETRSGAIRIAQLKPAPIRAFAESGAITVDLPNQYGYTIDAQSRSGKVSGSLTTQSGQLPDVHHFRRVVAGGGPLVDLDTGSSKIEIN